MSFLGVMTIIITVFCVRLGPTEAPPHENFRQKLAPPRKICHDLSLGDGGLRPPFTQAVVSAKFARGRKMLVNFL